MDQCSIRVAISGEMVVVTFGAERRRVSGTSVSPGFPAGEPTGASAGILKMLWKLIRLFNRLECAGGVDRGRLTNNPERKGRRNCSYECSAAGGVRDAHCARCCFQSSTELKRRIERSLIPRRRDSRAVKKRICS